MKFKEISYIIYYNYPEQLPSLHSQIKIFVNDTSFS